MKGTAGVALRMSASKSKQGELEMVEELSLSECLQNQF